VRKLGPTVTLFDFAAPNARRFLRPKKPGIPGRLNEPEA